MANATEHSVHAVHGTDPQSLIAAIVRQHVYASPYWKEQCFGLNAATILDRAVQLNHCGITHSEHLVPTPFLCLLLKMLQIQPDVAIIAELLQQAEYKYVRLLAALYWRLVGRGEEVYRRLEPLLADYRRVRVRKEDGGWELLTVDELVDVLLVSDKWRGLSLPRIMKRQQLVQLGKLEERRSLLDDEEDSKATPVEQQAEMQPQQPLPSPSPQQQQPAVYEQEAKQQLAPSESHRDIVTTGTSQPPAASSSVQKQAAVQPVAMLVEEQKTGLAAADGSNERRTAEATERHGERRDERSGEQRSRGEDDEQDRLGSSRLPEMERESERRRDRERERGRERQRDRDSGSRRRRRDSSSSASSSRSRSAERSRHRHRHTDRPRDSSDRERRHSSRRDHERPSGRSATERRRRRRRSRSSSSSRSSSNSSSGSRPRRRRRS